MCKVVLQVIAARLLLLSYFPIQVTGATEVVAVCLFGCLFVFFVLQCMLKSGHHGVAVEGKVHADAATSLADYPGLKSQTFTESSITGESPGICRDQDLHIFMLPFPHKPSLINQTLYTQMYTEGAVRLLQLWWLQQVGKMLQSLRISSFKLVSTAVQKSMCERAVE